MIDVQNVLIRNNLNVKKTSKELGIGESIIKRHLYSLKKAYDSSVEVKKKVKPKKDKKLVLKKKKEEKVELVVKDIPIRTSLISRIDYFDKKMGEIKYFATNEERLEHADNIINRDWL